VAEPLIWVATSSAEDLLFTGLVDALASLDTIEPRDAAIIGGVMVDILARERSLRMSRVTKDVDVGVHVAVLRSLHLAADLEARDYRRSEGHVFVKRSPDLAGASTIDILVPAYTSRQSRQKQVDDIVTIEVGMLAEALVTATRTDVRLVMTSGEQSDLRVPLPHPLAALTLKLGSWTARRASKDAFDVWRCLEVCARDRLGVADWEEMAALRAFASDAWVTFDQLESHGTQAAVGYAGLTGDDATRRAARIVALGRHLFDDGGT
jgi:hypothetical protein